MKKTLNQVVIIAIFIALITIIFTVYFPIYNNYKTKSFIHSATIITDPDSLYLQGLRDSLPYRNIQQKIESIISFRNYQNTIAYWGESYGGIVSVMNTDECDTCNYESQYYLTNFPKTKIKKYYLILSNYKGIEDSITSFHKPVYFKKKGKFYKKCLLQNKQYDYAYFNWETSEIKYGVEENLGKSKENELTNILIPISKFNYDILKYICWFSMLLFLAAYLIFVLGNVIYFVYNILMGEIFIVQNYIRLKAITIVLLIIPVLQLTSALITHLIYQSYFKSDFVFSFIWKDFWGSIFIALFALLLARIIRTGIEQRKATD